MKILVTGARGFTGRQFIAAATRAGHEAVPLRSDLRCVDDLRQELSALRVEAAVHLGAISFVAHDDERELYDVNLFGTLNLLRALADTAQPLAKVLLASSANVYGNSESSPIPETQPPAPVNHYAMTKLAMEHMASALFPQLPIVVTRPFNYTGPGQAEQFVIPKLVDHFRRRAPRVTLGNLHVQREYNDVRFVCEVYLRLLAAPVTQPVYNVCTGVTYDFNAVLQTLSQLTGHAIEVDVDPALVRPNEVHRLCGDPSRVREIAGDVPSYALADTLRWMLAA